MPRRKWLNIEPGQIDFDADDLLFQLTSRGTPCESIYCEADPKPATTYYHGTDVLIWVCQPHREEHESMRGRATGAPDHKQSKLLWHRLMLHSFKYVDRMSNFSLRQAIIEREKTERKLSKTDDAPRKEHQRRLRVIMRNSDAKPGMADDETLLANQRVIGSKSSNKTVGNITVPQYRSSEQEKVSLRGRLIIRNPLNKKENQ